MQLWSNTKHCRNASSTEVNTASSKMIQERVEFHNPQADVMGHGCHTGFMLFEASAVKELETSTWNCTQHRRHPHTRAAHADPFTPSPLHRTAPDRVELQPFARQAPDDLCSLDGSQGPGCSYFRRGSTTSLAALTSGFDLRKH